MDEACFARAGWVEAPGFSPGNKGSGTAGLQARLPVQTGISFRRRLRRQAFAESAVLILHLGQQAPRKTRRLQRLTMLSQGMFGW